MTFVPITLGDRMRYCAVVFFLAFVWSLSPQNVFANQNESEQLALNAAKDWLNLVDKGNYAESWKQAALYFRISVPKKKWIRSMEAARKPMGNILTRKLLSKSYETTLPGAPDGEYVVIQFKTSFQNKKSAIETITPQKDKDGKWRVCGFFIK